MKKIILFSFLLTLSFPLYSQLVGKKSKLPYKSNIDGYTYKIGDEITLGFPSKGGLFQNVSVFDYQNKLDQIFNTLDVITGKPVNAHKIIMADKFVSQFKGIILFFQIQEIDKKDVTFAIIDYKDNKRLAVAIDTSLASRELVSLNPQYREQLAKNDLNPQESEMIVKSFDPNFNIKVLSVIGSTNDQTVTITFLISHKLVHQKVSFFPHSSNGQLFDFNGNVYSYKNYDSHNDKIPTNVPVKKSITFKQILPEVKDLSFLTLKVNFGPIDGYNEESGNLEVSNLKVNWK